MYTTKWVALSYGSLGKLRFDKALLMSEDERCERMVFQGSLTEVRVRIPANRSTMTEWEGYQYFDGMTVRAIPSNPAGGP